MTATSTVRINMNSYRYLCRYLQCICRYFCYFLTLVMTPKSWNEIPIGSLPILFSEWITLLTQHSKSFPLLTKEDQISGVSLRIRHVIEKTCYRNHKSFVYVDVIFVLLRVLNKLQFKTSKLCNPQLSWHYFCPGNLPRAYFHLKVRR